MTRIQLAIGALALAAAACSPPASETAAPEPAAPAPAASAVPADVAAAVSAASPGITIANFERSAENGQYEVTGTMPNGDEVELDLEQSNGAWRVTEIERDVAWSAVPGPVRAAASAGRGSFEAVRVMESREIADGSVTYEVFTTADPSPAAPSMQVRWQDGKAVVVRPETPAP
jgi:hypothetical protein